MCTYIQVFDPKKVKNRLQSLMHFSKITFLGTNFKVVLTFCAVSFCVFFCYAYDSKASVLNVNLHSAPPVTPRNNFLTYCSSYFMYMLSWRRGPTHSSHCLLDSAREATLYPN